MLTRKIRILIFLLANFLAVRAMAQNHPRIYISQKEKPAFLHRLKQVESVKDYIDEIQQELDPYVDQHRENPAWIVSRLQMYWKTKYQRVYVNGMDFSHGEGAAPVPTVRFSGSRDWDTDYLVPDIADIQAYMDDERGLYLQNDKKAGKPWEWVQPSETGHIVERINKKILDLAEDAAFLYWLYGDEKYAVFASDIFMTYIEGMHHREPPLTVEDHKNKDLMGLQTFEVIHEGVIKPITLCYDFLYSYLKEKEKDLNIIQQVFRKWADQEIKYGVPGNNWNLMQARYIAYLALALEDDQSYKDGKGQQYYIDQVLNQNSRKQKALRDVMENFDPNTGIWPEVAHYSIMVSDDILEVFSLMDKSLDNNLLATYPMLEKAILANFNYLFPHGFTAAYGDAKHARLRVRPLELLIAQYRKYNQPEKEKLVTGQLKRFMKEGVYDREEIKNLFQLFYYVEELADVPVAASFEALAGPTFYSPNVSWIVQRNGNGQENGMMISKNASLGNHSHANGINLELYAKGMVIAPDAAAGVSYWSKDHQEYYSRFPAHNTVIVDGKSDYRPMNTYQAFKVRSLYPSPDISSPLTGDFTFSDVFFIEPATVAYQYRLTGTVRTSPSSGYFVDIFRSARNDKQDKKHEYVFHGQGEEIVLSDFTNKSMALRTTDELSSQKGDLPGYDYFTNKKETAYAGNFIAQFKMPSLLHEELTVNLWMKGYENRSLFTVDAPYSRALHPESVPKELYHKAIPTLIVRQEGEALSRPFVAIIDAYNQGEQVQVQSVSYFSPQNEDPDFVGISVHSKNNRTDHIYNNLKQDTEQIFPDGSFTGTYAVVSYQHEALHALFLGKGTRLEKDDYKIEALEDAGAVWVEFVEEGLRIDAEIPFKLSLPLIKGSKAPLKLRHVHESGKVEVFVGKVSQKNKQAIVQYELPVMENADLSFSE